MQAIVEGMSGTIGDPKAILRLRLANQHLSRQRLREPGEIVAHLGAVQSQDYPGALWALAQRLDRASLQSLESAFNRGDFLRTHVLRPTWHFVAPADIRWMVALTGPRIRRSMASRERELGMDQALVDRANDAIARTLEGGKALTRQELGAALTAAGIDWRSDGSVLAHLLSSAELAGVVCSGPMQGKQHTYALLEERVPPAPVLSREEAVAEVVCRYFTSHGPATLNDFAWWSGMTTADARQGLAAYGSRFASEQVGELTYWFAADGPAPKANGPAALLLPNYDEFTVAYRFRKLFYAPEVVYRPGPRDDVPFGNVIVMGGLVVGFFKRAADKQRLVINATWLSPPTDAQLAAFDQAVERYAAFLGVPR